MSKSEFPSIFPRIETARLILREITHADTHAIFRNFSEPEIAKWFFEEPLTDIDQAKQFIDQFNSEFKQGEGITWAIEMKKNNACVGTCSIAGVSIGGEGEIGFDLAKEYWGKGIMSESLTAILDYGFSVLNLSKIDAHTYSTNIKAKHLLEKLGFQLEKVSEDSDYYSLTMEA